MLIHRKFSKPFYIQLGLKLAVVVCASMPVAAARANPPTELGSLRTQLLQRAEGALQLGDAALAINLLEQAELLAHSADTEMGLVRAQMQAGQYQKALSFAAHAAGAHPDEPGGALLYAWLLKVGGQQLEVIKLIESAKQRWPNNSLVDQVQRQLKLTAPVANKAMLAGAGRLAPYGSPKDLIANQAVIGSGLLIAGGQRVLIAWPSISRYALGAHLWVRTSLGVYSKASIEQQFDDIQIAVLKLDAPIKTEPNLPVCKSDPFGGSIAHALDFSRTQSAVWAWPVLSSGFMGLPIEGTPFRSLDIGQSAGQGGIVLDQYGSFCGIAFVPALTNLQGTSARLVLASRIDVKLAERLGLKAPATATPKLSPVELYERMLPHIVQVSVSK
jgi:tetratricopeptide (TPR) repeat protein